MPNKKLAFLSYCCIASTADFRCSRLASYTGFGMGERSCWYCAYQYCSRYQAAPMEKNRSRSIRFCKTVFSFFKQKALRNWDSTEELRQAIDSYNNHRVKMGLKR